MKKLLLLLIPFASLGQVKISDMTAATSLSGTELVPIVQGGVNKKATVSLWNTEYSNYYKVTTWAALVTYVAGLGAGVDVNLYFPFPNTVATSNLNITNKGAVNLAGEYGSITNGLSAPGDVITISNVGRVNVSRLICDFNLNANLGDFFDINGVAKTPIFENIHFVNFGHTNQVGLRLQNVPTPSANGQNFNEPGAIFTNVTASNPINYSTYDYNNNNTRGIGIFMTDAAEYLKMVNCAFSNVNVGLWLVNGGNGSIANTHFINCLPRISAVNYGALYMVGGGSNGGKLLITNCSFNHNWGYGIWNDYNVTGRPIEVINCHFIANAITPIVINSTSSNNQIMNSFFDRANLASTAANNPFGAVTSRYIYLNNNSNNTISDNSFQTGVSGTAIVTLGSSGNNKIRDNDVATGVTLASLVGTTDIITGNERKFTFQPDATVAGMNFGSRSAAPSTLVNADVFYNTTTNQLSGRINGATTNFLFDDYAQTITNKTISGASNTLSNIPNASITGLGSLALLSSVNNSNWSGTVLSVANGGTGTSTPALVAGTNVTITGTWPNQTINSSGGGGGMTDPMTTRGDIIIRDATNTTARLGVGTNGQVLGTNGTDVSWVAAGGTTYYAPNSIVSNATDANFTATVNGIHNILDGVATANRVITILTGLNSDVMKFYNTEDTYVWSFTGATVYLSDRVTVVTELQFNYPCFMEKIDGLWIITN